MVNETMLGSFMAVVMLFLPVSLTIYSIVKGRQDKKQDTVKENTAVITELNVTIRTLSSVITELKGEYKQADARLEAHLNDHDKKINDHETRITVIEGRV